MLTARANLFAAPALVSAVQLEGRAEPATAQELSTFRAALTDCAAALLEASRALSVVSRALHGPEPKVLRDLNSRPAGAKATSAARSRPRPPMVLSTGVRPPDVTAAAAAASGRAR
ncbi:hypothetical protein [Kitasatospora sp. NPDC057015]|uniref:hypothetical protein n=1 Tax=Kitasatospora sp. NPDC057015 TaxID=3346001 RepID=UPI00364257AE